MVSVVDQSFSSRRRRSSARHGSSSNSRRSAPITMSSAVAVCAGGRGSTTAAGEARQQLICASDDGCAAALFPTEARAPRATGCADTALAARWPTTARDSADRSAGQKGNQPSRVHVTASGVCFRLRMSISIYCCIYVQYKSRIRLNSVGCREKGNFGKLWTGIDRKALPDKALRVSVQR